MDIFLYRLFVVDAISHIRSDYVALVVSLLGAVLVALGSNETMPIALLVQLVGAFSWAYYSWKTDQNPLLIANLVYAGILITGIVNWGIIG